MKSQHFPFIWTTTTSPPPPPPQTTTTTTLYHFVFLLDSNQQKNQCVYSESGKKITKLGPKITVIVVHIYVQSHPTSKRALLCLNVRKLRPLVHMISVVLNWISVWSTGGMTLTGEKRRLWIKSCLTATLSTTNPTRTDLGLNQWFLCKRPAKSRLRRDTIKPRVLQYGV